MRTSPAEVGIEPDPDAPTRVRFVLERHLGHQTYADNLLDVARGRSDIAVEVVDVDYAVPTREWFPGVLDGYRASLAGRRAVRAGLQRTPSDVDVYNTQVPAALAGRARARPFVAVTDVTPIQMDAIGAGYGHAPDRFAPLRSIKHRINRRMFQEAAACVGWSSWVAESLRDDYDVDEERVAVIPPGVDLERWSPDGPTGSSDDVELLFVGGEFARKGGTLLLDVLRELPEHVRLTVVTRDAVPAHPRVTTISDLAPNDDRLIALYQAADVFVLPSRAETFGIAAVEASAAGLPVVASAIGGLHDIVDDRTTGLLVPPNDARALRDALVEVVADPTRRAAMANAARERAVERFDAVANANRLIGLARSVVQ